MVNVLKALIATLISFGPTAVREYVHRIGGDQWSDWALFALAGAVFATTWKFIQPDERFLKVRDPALKNYIKQSLKTAESQNLRIRANVYVKWGFGPFSWLVPAFAYAGNTADPDYGKRWYWGRGMCWRVFSKGQFGFCRTKDDPPSAFGMTPADIEATQHVNAVLCLPIRKVPSSGKAVDRKVVAVLAFDAICESGGDFLRNQHESLSNRQNQELLDLVDSISLYF